jgi:hypothetical protein
MYLVNIGSGTTLFRRSSRNPLPLFTPINSGDTPALPGGAGDHFP